MDSVLLEFVACCRANGMRISTAEVLDCLEQLTLIPSWNEVIFHTVLRTNLSKSRIEQADFERIYALFFKEMKKGAGSTDDPAGKQSLTEGSMEDIDPSVSLDHVMKEMVVADFSDSDIDQALGEFMTGNPRLFIEIVRQVHDQESKAAPAVKSNLGQLALRLEIMVAIGKMRQKVVRILGSADAAIRGVANPLESIAQQRLDSAMAFLSADPQPDNPGLKTGGTQASCLPVIGEIPFANLTPDEIDWVREVIDQWVKKLNDAASLRFAASRKGAMDVKKTISRSRRYLGVPVEIIRKERPLRKGKIVTLCDVSGSVWSSARFMLNILYSLQSCFARVKSYVFVDRPVSVTQYFLSHDANQAIAKILKDPEINFNARTDYGMTFQSFHTDHLADLDKKTTLIIMGDGRSNYFNFREPLLARLRDRCRRLVWLNPEQEQFWGTGDSEMLRCRRYCNEARACGNLNQLIEFIQGLVL